MGLVVGEGERFKLFVANGLEDVPEWVLYLSQKAEKNPPKGVTAKLRSPYVIDH